MFTHDVYTCIVRVMQKKTQHHSEVPCLWCRRCWGSCPDVPQVEKKT